MALGKMANCHPDRYLANYITSFFQMDQENMALAGGDVIILLVLLFYLPLGMVKIIEKLS